MFVPPNSLPWFEVDSNSWRWTIYMDWMHNFCNCREMQTCKFCIKSTREVLEKVRSKYMIGSFLYLCWIEADGSRVWVQDSSHLFVQVVLHEMLLQRLAVHESLAARRALVRSISWALWLSVTWSVLNLGSSGLEGTSIMWCERRTKCWLNNPVGLYRRVFPGFDRMV